MISALAVTASIAIENARLYEESRQRQEWLRASGEISRNLLLSEDTDIDTLRRIAVSVKRLAAADVVSVALPLRGEEASELEVVTAVGIGQEDLTGLRYPPADSIAWRAMQEGRGLIVQDVDRQPGVFLHLRHAAPVTQAMAVPLMGESGARGALIAGRVGRHHLHCGRSRHGRDLCPSGHDRTRAGRCPGRTATPGGARRPRPDRPRPA